MSLHNIEPTPAPDTTREDLARVAAQSVKAPVSSVSLHERKTLGSAMSGLFNDYAPLGYQLPFEILDYVELIARYNPDYSQAVSNAKTLANAGHELFVDDRSKRRASKVKGRLEEKARLIQEGHGGIDGLIEKLLDQAVTFGALCGEWLVSEQLDDVVDFVDINPKVIRFFWEEDDQRWAPYQKVTYLQAKEAEKRGQKVQGSCVKLNEETFVYCAFDAAPNSPYGTPPFLAALANIAIQRDMVYNMAQIVKKVGLLGIIDVTVEQLKKTPGETDEAFVTRATSFLAQYREVAENMFRDGGIVHFDDVNVDATNVSGNAAGATNIFKQNEELIFSGLKSMPSVHGRSYSTTETYAGVAYDIIIRNTYKYQRAVKRVIERGYYLMTTMWGDVPDRIKLTFHDNKTLHRLQNAQAERIELQNSTVLWIAGLIDQAGFGQRHGFSNPKEELDAVPDSLAGFAGARPATRATMGISSPVEGDEDDADYVAT